MAETRFRFLDNLKPTILCYLRRFLKIVGAYMSFGLDDKKFAVGLKRVVYIAEEGGLAGYFVRDGDGVGEIYFFGKVVDPKGIFAAYASFNSFN